jgi:NADH-quinone oxidoreductase subunit F
MLGSGGIIVLDDQTCMVDACWNLMRFYHHESCGQCTPCREGTGWLEKIFERMEHGGGQEDDLAVIDEMGWNMRGQTICVLADAAAMPAQGFIQKWRQEFIEHFEKGRCPLAGESGGCASLHGAMEPAAGVVGLY